MSDVTARARFFTSDADSFEGRPPRSTGIVMPPCLVRLARIDPQADIPVCWATERMEWPDVTMSTARALSWTAIGRQITVRNLSLIRHILARFLLIISGIPAKNPSRVKSGSFPAIECSIVTLDERNLINGFLGQVFGIYQFNMHHGSRLS